jgi:hypothetical protein
MKQTRMVKRGQGNGLGIDSSVALNPCRLEVAFGARNKGSRSHFGLSDTKRHAPARSLARLAPTTPLRSSPLR